MPFQKGNPGGPGRRGKKYAPGTGDVLADMKHAYNQPASADTTQAHKTCRKWLEEAPSAFMARMTELERKGQGGEAPPGAGPDLGTEKCLQLIEQLLEEFNEANPEDRR